MTNYIAAQRPVVRYRQPGRRRRASARAMRARGPGGLGGIVDNFATWIEQNFSYDTSETACLNEAQAQTAGLDAKITDLALTWVPTGNYTPAQVTSLVNQTIAIIQQAATQVNNAPRSTGDSESMIQNSIRRLMDHSQKGLRFIQAATDAVNQGADVVSIPKALLPTLAGPDADDLKTWVIQSQLEASAALVNAFYNECQLPDEVEAIATYMKYFDLFAGFVRAIVGVVISVADKVFQLPHDLSNLFDGAVKVSLIAGGAYLAYLLFAKKKPKPKS